MLRSSEIFSYSIVKAILDIYADMIFILLTPNVSYGGVINEHFVDTFISLERHYTSPLLMHKFALTSIVYSGYAAPE